MGFAVCSLSALFVVTLTPVIVSAASLVKIKSEGTIGQADFSINGLTAAKANGEAALVKGQFTDKRGHVHTRLQQTFNGVKIYHGETILHERVDDKASLTGYQANGFAESLAGIDASSFDVEKSIRAAKSLARSVYFEKTSKRGLSFIFTNAETFVYIRDDGAAEYVYKIRFLIDSPRTVVGPVFILSAETGELIKTWNALKQDVQEIGTGPGGNELEGCVRYDDTGLGKMQVTVNGASCATQNDVLTVSTCANKAKCVKKYWKYVDIPYEFTCPESDGSDVKKSHYGGCSPVNDVLFLGTKYIDFLREVHSMTTFQDRVQLFAHYKKKEINAFYACEVDMGFFGDGHKKWAYPLTCADIVAHEIAHGVTCNLSDLEYDGPSGGANEAFSDMSGKVLEAYIYGDIQYGWQIGACSSKTGRPFRYMDDPPLNGRSIDHVDGYVEGLDVHRTSGVLNKAFTILTESEGWDIYSAYEVFLMANANYWTSLATFQEQGEGVLQTAIDLNYTTAAIVDALGQVGIVV